MIAKLHIQTATRNDITYLSESFFTPPFKLADITEDKQSKCLHLMVMNSSPGVLDGDDYEIKVELSEKASVQLHTQSYQRLFNMKRGASQRMAVYLQKGSSFIYLPHPSVPHENSLFTAKNKIFLSEACSLVWGEVLTCGRKLNGEIFLFTAYHTITEVFINNQLIIKENLLMQPSVIDPRSLGLLEGFTHQASLICLNQNGNINDQQDEVQDYLSRQNDILFGVTSRGGNGMIVRILGYGAEQLHHHLQGIAFIAQQQKISHPVKPAYAD
jgi:urease accessory protein